MPSALETSLPVWSWGKRSKTWSESRADCSSLQDLTRDVSQFWVGLSVPSPEKAWTWLDGARLDQTL
uniref:C-type lectin domain-containing protein n=1 Tax=Terrapene triunguis TaxID=2587831 RepID=A0A674IR07_9SAUR